MSFVYLRPPLPLSAILQKLNLRLAFIHSHLICLIFTQGRDVVYIMRRYFEKLVLVIYSGPGEKPKSQIVDLHKCVSSVGLGMASAAGTLNPQLFQIMTVFGMISDNGGVWKYLQIIARVGLGTVLLDYVPNVPNIQLCPNSMHIKPYSSSALGQTDKVGS